MSKEKVKEIIEFDWVPVMEDLDLGINATNATVSTKLFSYITEIVITLQLADAAIEWTEFLAGSALTNGLFVSVDGRAITPVIKTKGQLCEIGEARILTKDNDNVHIIQVRLDFLKWCGNLGLQAQGSKGQRTVVFDINDDLSSITGLFTAVVKGWRMD